MNTETQPRTNIPEFSVSDLAGALKRTLEDNFGRIRVRGELSRISRPSSGHLYTALKDEQSVIDAVCWKGTLPRLSIKPEEGMEVICTGRITTYAPRSSYQLVIESMELAGQGALLKMLEERRKKLGAEGLFDAGRKKTLPFLPEIIGVVTSPTGSVIRDIIHRLNDRFPRHVIVWPVIVQGEAASKQIAEAIQGFNAISKKSGKRPDLIIVARGGGSLEDLMPFNEENVVRAVAQSDIPIISAVGHETDTTLIDYAADFRAPTPTGAAEMAVPVRLNLLAQIKENEKRLIHALTRTLSENRHRLKALEASLGQPERVLELKTQKTDHLAHKIDILYRQILNDKNNRLHKTSIRLTHPLKMLEIKENGLNQTYKNLQAGYRFALEAKLRAMILRSSSLLPPTGKIRENAQRLESLHEKLAATSKILHERKGASLAKCAEKLEILSFENVLERGYAVIFDQKRNVIKDINDIKKEKTLTIRLRQGQEIEVITDTTGRALETE